MLYGKVSKKISEKAMKKRYKTALKKVTNALQKMKKRYKTALKKVTNLKRTWLIKFSRVLLY